MVILGIGAGLTFPTLSGAAVGSVPGPRFAVATALNSVSRQLGAALGVAVLIAILGNPSPQQALHAFEHGWLFAGACFLVGSIVCLALVVRRTGAAGAIAGNERSAQRAVTKPHGSRRWSRLTPSCRASRNRRASAPRCAPQTVAEFLRIVPVFAGLSQKLLEEIAALARNVSLDQRGAGCSAQGDAADGVYVVRVGHLEVIAGGRRVRERSTRSRAAPCSASSRCSATPCAAPRCARCATASC